jgi:hypothetical protein
METAIGEGLDGRMYTDLSRLTPQTTVTATESFYVRTRASELLEGPKWVVRLNGLLTKPVELSLAELNKSAKPMGVHLLECAGNARSVHFGLMSAADWAGVPLSDLLESAKAKPQSTRILVSGFDTYPTKSVSSQPGAIWVFTWDELKRARVFLATEMNGDPFDERSWRPDPLDGSRLVRVRLHKMGEGNRTDGCLWPRQLLKCRSLRREPSSRACPNLVRDFKPATIDQAAMPTRIEKWLLDERIMYRLTGILWGGSRPVNTLEIRFNPEQDYVPVESVQQKANDPWSFWTHSGSPKQPGTYLMRLRIKNPQIAATRLNTG